MPKIQNVRRDVLMLKTGFSGIFVIFRFNLKKDLSLTFK